MSAAGPAVAVGLVLDAVLGEPPAPLHPVARFGDAMRALERHTYRDDVIAGATHAVVGGGAALASGWLLERVIGRRGALAASIGVASAGRMLTAEVTRVGQALENDDLDGARRLVGGLVGRDTSGLDPNEVARAAIESLAENAVDAVTAGVWWGVVGGAPAVLGHRALNTLDAMVGHRSLRYERFGWASARLDDVANWVPARLTSVGAAIAHPSRARAVVRTVRRDAWRHPSPNGGVVEAAMAAVLGVRLGGTNRYGNRTEDRGTLGDGPQPTPADVQRAVAAARRATIATVGLVLVGEQLVRGCARATGRRRPRR
ncbi:MAG: adenosylcobinamide-phosphate synthase CbiB [Ilumatobacteraceae bacterium]